LRASSIASSMTFFVRGESVISLGEVVESPRPMMNSTAVRTFESSTPSESRTRARNAFALADEPKEQVLRSDVVVVETDGLVLGKREHPLRAVIEAIEGSHPKALARPYIAVAGIIGSDYTFGYGRVTALRITLSMCARRDEQTTTAAPFPVDGHDWTRSTSPACTRLSVRRPLH
jgi:hypothetical protein